MEKMNKVLLYVSIIALVLFPFNIYGAVILSVGAFLLSLIFVKDKVENGRVLQNTILLIALLALKFLFSTILDIPYSFAYAAENYDALDVISKIMYICDTLVTFALFAFITISIIFAVINKDIFVVNLLSNKILGIKTEKAEKTVEVKTVNREKPKKESEPKPTVKTTKSGKIIIDATKKPDDEA